MNKRLDQQQLHKQSDLEVSREYGALGYHLIISPRDTILYLIPQKLSDTQLMNITMLTISLSCKVERQKVVTGF